MARRKLPLSEQEKLFCDKYLVTFNATEAYSYAYPGAKSVEGAAVSASRLLRRAKVAEYLRTRMDQRAARTEITQDRVLKELARLAFSNILDFVEFDAFTFRASLKASADMDPDQAACIASVEGGAGTSTKVRLHPKLPALIKCMQHVGLLPKGDTLRLINDRGEPMIPAAAIQHAIQSGLAQGPEWMEGLVSKSEMKLLFPERFRALGENS